LLSLESHTIPAGNDTPCGQKKVPAENGLLKAQLTGNVRDYALDGSLNVVEAAALSTVAERSVRRRKNVLLPYFVPSCRTMTPPRGIPPQGFIVGPSAVRN